MQDFFFSIQKVTYTFCVHDFPRIQTTILEYLAWWLYSKLQKQWIKIIFARDERSHAIRAHYTSDQNENWSIVE